MYTESVDRQLFPEVDVLSGIVFICKRWGLTNSHVLFGHLLFIPAARGVSSNHKYSRKLAELCFLITFWCLCHHCIHFFCNATKITVGCRLCVLIHVASLEMFHLTSMAVLVHRSDAVNEEENIFMRCCRSAWFFFCLIGPMLKTRLIKMYNKHLANGPVSQITDLGNSWRGRNGLSFLQWPGFLASCTLQMMMMMWNTNSHGPKQITLWSISQVKNL